MTAPLLAVALALAAPPPPLPDRKPAPDDVADRYVDRLAPLIPKILERYPRTVSRGRLVSAAIAGLYRAIDQPVPAQFRDLTDDTLDARAVLRSARKQAGTAHELSQMRDFIRSANGFAQALDPACTLTLAHNGPFTMSDQELLGGFELEGVDPVEWIAYRIETGPRSGWRVTPPVPLPWKVRRVTSGLAAAAADLRPGDVILTIDGLPVTDDSAPKLLPPLLVPLSGVSHAEVGSAAGRNLIVKVRREEREHSVVLEIPKDGVDLLPRETVFGFRRRPGGDWDYFANEQEKVAYLRLTGFDNNTPGKLIKALGEIADARPIGLLIDVRWSPGGSLQVGGQVASPFFRSDQELAKVVWRDPARAGEKLPRLPLGAVDEELWQTLPLAVLINQETTGGGETLAGAVRDHKRGLLMGQRTPGRGLFYLSTPLEIPGLRFRITSGSIDFPSGRVRHRHDNTGPLDDWGVRPDPGYEIPTTPDFSKKLREWHDRQTIRPAGNPNAIALDDPLLDTPRALAMKLFRESIEKKRKK